MKMKKIPSFRDTYPRRALFRASLFLFLLLPALLLSACRTSSDYMNASVSIPDNYAAYQVGEFSFRFEAGWEKQELDSMYSALDTQAALVGITPNLALFGRLAAPPSDQSTVDYVDFGYFELGARAAASELEDIMEAMDTHATLIKEFGLRANQLQKSRIRSYAPGIDALTYCYRIIGDRVTTVVQTALIPNGSRVYVIIYSDFTSGEDNNLLERILSSLSFTEE